MQAKPHTSLVTALVGVVLTLALAAPAEQPAFPNAVPSQPGALTGPAADSNAGRAHEHYLTSYGDPKPIAQVSAPTHNGGIDWRSIGIARLTPANLDVRARLVAGLWRVRG